MRSLLITLTVGTTVLLLSGCPDLPGARVPAQSDTHMKAPRTAHGTHESSGRSYDNAHPGGDHHNVGEIAWFQGTIDEAFSRRGCSEGRRRTLFSF